MLYEVITDSDNPMPENSQKKEKETTKTPSKEKKPFDEKPFKAKVLDKTAKHTISQAVKDVLTLPKFKGFTELPATMVFRTWKDDLSLELNCDNLGEFKAAILQKAFDLQYIDYGKKSDCYIISPTGEDFIKAVKGRLISLHGKKYMTPLFEGLQGVDDINKQFNSELDLLIKGEFVITSYSIHYTKLYETGAIMRVV